MTRSARPGTSHRLLRVGEAIRHGLADILARGELRDPSLEGVSVTVSEVRPSPDLRHATVFVMPLGGRDLNDVLAGLNRCGGFLSHLVAEKVQLKYSPRLVFRSDPSFDAAGRIEALLKDPRVARDLEEHGQDDAEDDFKDGIDPSRSA